MSSSLNTTLLETKYLGLHLAPSSLELAYLKLAKFAYIEEGYIQTAILIAWNKSFLHLLLSKPNNYLFFLLQLHCPFLHLTLNINYSVYCLARTLLKALTFIIDF